MALGTFQENISYLQRRFIFVVVGICVVFFAVLARLYYLQIIHGEKFRAFADQNTLKEIRLPAPRGVIYDRFEVPLVSNRPAFDLTVVPQYVPNISRLQEGLHQLAGIEPADIATAWQKIKKLPPFFPIVVAEDIGYGPAAKIAVYRAIDYEQGDPFDLRGVEVMPYPLRRYPQGNLLASTLGYVREASRQNLSLLQSLVPGGYFLGDRIGAIGLERRWELLLKGKDGYEQRIVNAVGKEVASDDLALQLVRQKARAGNDLVTTIDSRLQRVAEEQFAGKSGALVAMDPESGAIYAMVSRPSYELETLVSHVSNEYWQQLTSDPGKLFLNRAINAAYPPGSTYKIVVATAALEEGVVRPDETIYCPGAFHFGNRRFRCWKSGGHGRVELHRAIVQSCDVYFYTMGVRLGVDRLARYAHKFGLGRPVGIEIDPESPGLIPTEEWKRRVRKEPWYPGETPSISIGQGYDLMTPLQNAVVISAIANGGYRVRPTLTGYFLDREGRRFPPPDRLFLSRRTSLGLSAETVARVQKGVAGVVSEPGGTGRRLSVLPFPSAGKTGTAQVVSSESGLSGAAYRDHAWYVGYAPIEHPEIAVSVLVEHGGHGSAAAAPIAGEVMKAYFEGRQSDEQTTVFQSD